MKKQFYRVKQLADQRVGRAEKTEILTEDLQMVEKTVDKIKQACQSTNKRLTTAMQGTGTEIEKRLALWLMLKSKHDVDEIAMVWPQMKSEYMRKLHQTALAQAMLESSTQLGETSLLGVVLEGAGEAQASLARELAEYEMLVERGILGPMSTVLENDIPSIAQAKKKLSKTRLDMDTCKSRWLTALKASHGASKDMYAAAAKADVLKEEYEEQMNKFENCQDILATELLTFVAKEGEYAEWILKFISAQLDYHKKAAAILERVVPSLTSKVDGSVLQPVYGTSLDDHLRIHDREISFVLQECLTFLYSYGMEVEGLFRLAGSTLKIRKLKAEFDAGLVDLSEFENDIHVVTGALKQYLREMPEPIMMFSLYDEWIKAFSIQDSGARLQAYWTLVERLSPSHKANLRYLISFLGKLAACSDTNKMNASNIAIVIAPNVLWAPNGDGTVNVHHTGILSSIVESLIQHSTWFFPEEIDFTRRKPLLDGTNGTSVVPRPQADPGSSDQVASVSGGFLEEVVNLVNLNESCENTLTVAPRDQQSNEPGPAVLKPTPATSEKKRAPPVQVKFLGSSAATSPTSTTPSVKPTVVHKPTTSPPPPPAKPLKK